MKKQILFAAGLILALLADQLSKITVRKFMFLGEKLELSNILSLHYTINTGIAFSFLQGWSNVLLIVTILIVLGLLYYHKEFFHTNSTTVAIGLIIGGALGNIFDRIFYGRVTDFISVLFWPTFNLADSAISIGAILLTVHYWKHKSSVTKAFKYI